MKRSGRIYPGDVEAAGRKFNKGVFNTEAFNTMAPKRTYKEWKDKSKSNQTLADHSGSYLVWCEAQFVGIERSLMYIQRFLFRHIARSRCHPAATMWTCLSYRVYHTLGPWEARHLSLVYPSLQLPYSNCSETTFIHPGCTSAFNTSSCKSQRS